FDERMSTQALNSWSRSSADIPIKQVSQNIWEVPQDYQPGMKVPARIYADEDLLAKMRTDRTIQQCVNVTHLNGIYKYAITMPDGHEGYGFPIGGVAATDYDEGLISPGGVGYDINCGVRLIRTNLTEGEVRPRLSQLVDTIFNFIPSGLGSRGQIKLSPIELDKAVTDGLDWAIDKGYAWPEDPKTIEEEGCMEAADPSKVSSSARSRGAPQLGSLGSGNHFIEIERTDRIFDERVAQRLGIQKTGQILVLIHTGSRGYGHQICSDYLKVMERATGKYNIHLPDRELAACPSKSTEPWKQGNQQLGFDRHNQSNGVEFRNQRPWRWKIHEAFRGQTKVARCRLEETAREQRDSHQSGKHGGCLRGSTGRLQGCGQSGRCKRPTWNRKESCPHDTHRSGERIERSREIKTCYLFLYSLIRSVGVGSIRLSIARYRDT